MSYRWAEGSLLPCLGCCFFAVGQGFLPPASPVGRATRGFPGFRGWVPGTVPQGCAGKADPGHAVTVLAAFQSGALEGIPEGEQSLAKLKESTSRHGLC